MPERTDTVWKTPALTSVYLDGVRRAIPLAQRFAGSGLPVQFVNADYGLGIVDDRNRRLRAV
jgi:hypothetical protein